MQLNLPQLAVSTILLSLFSCGEKAENTIEPKAFSLEIIDSVQVDYLGEMMLLDYDAKAEKYLLATDAYYEYLEVNEDGKILNQNKFSEDGIDAVGQALGLGYFNGDVTVFNPPKGYYIFRDSTKVAEISISYPFQVFMMYPKLGVFESGDKIYYPKPWPETLAIKMEEGEFYQELYRLPIIESQDKISGDTLGALSLPESSDLLGDQVHGFPIPVYTLDEDNLMLSMWFEPRFYVYNKVGDQFMFEKTVDVNIPDWVPYTPVALDKAEQFFEVNRKKRAGILTNILVSGDYYIAVYNKGLSEEEMTKLGPPTDGGLAIRKKNPNYAAIFDKDFNQLATNVPFPIASNYPNVVNNSGELIVSKVAGLSETEDDGIVLYKLKLKFD
ncbi:hypothetical protein [Algoriphagus chordae]|uniref:6-bladed beta-propeller protein n=1 Tax=Algoriphagus chordae TaxID=237019 RepID=A0A2W7QX60_9BACT|nr:hypothetical protein [Algoriphagus chordae]PZX50620.1 hypothetical protein LV85_02727 [Algoriphagus chordae]